MSSDRIFLNPAASSWRWSSNDKAHEPSATEVLDFHQTLPSYGRTPLHSLPSLATELGLGHVLLKDESARFGLPSFKILGASYGVARAVLFKLGIPVSNDGTALSFDFLGSAAREHGISLVTCTEGNWGRAVARMAAYLGVPAKIFVPSFMPGATRARIEGEGAEVVVVDGDYDDSVAAAKQEADKHERNLLVMDFGWEGYERIPQWVVQGYSTMLSESDEQVLEHTGDSLVTHAFVPVGVGSIAQAVTQHYKSSGRMTPAKVVTVEPTTAASLKSSLESGRISPIETKDTIMCGMNCGTISTTAWPVLKSGVDASVVVTDAEAHQAVQDLTVVKVEVEGEPNDRVVGIEAGPCGASTLAALRRAVRDARGELGFDNGSVVVLYCTEGPREYDVPA